MVPKTIIYYFSGTGNSLAVARQLAAALDEASVVPIIGRLSPQMTPSAPRMGLVFPLYWHGLPEIVLRFVRRVGLAGAGYIFVVITRGSSSGQAVHQLQEILQQRGAKLSFAAKVDMPGNYIVESNTAGAGEINRILARAREKVSSIALKISSGSSEVDLDSSSDIAEARKLYGPWLASVNEKDRLFSVEDTCTSCGVCVQVCPVGNIAMENKRPKWNHRCQQCLACIHFCPEEAIQVPGSKARGRYHHPGVNAEDMMRRSLPI